MNRVAFLVDGFNVYHSARKAREDLGGKSTLWLDLRSLLTSYLSSSFGRDAVLSEIHYFSALATHMDGKRPGTTNRHRLYLDCLRSTGVQIHLGRFKYKTVWCASCKQENPHYEEKETDVALSAKLLELFHTDKCDTVVLMTGDTDLAPAVRTAAQIFPEKTVCFAFPYKRKNKELMQLATSSFLVRKERYAAHQFPDPVVLPNGRQIRKPPDW
ncbi:MAG: NYN domain-containing protein [Gammaproteobacteria bacterium]|nr:NYN domain-containing protein [Gammaproteobacteria bacterium]